MKGLKEPQRLNTNKVCKLETIILKHNPITYPKYLNEISKELVTLGKSYY